MINYKREHGDWEELQVEAGTSEHVLPNLWCGTRYQLYITAFNRIGTGLPCDIVHAYTKGTVPVKPKHSQMITLNTTTVTVWLDSWGDGGCGILYFVIEYREMSQTQVQQLPYFKLSSLDLEACVSNTLFLVFSSGV